MALSVSCGLGTEISVPDSNRFGEASRRRWGAGDLRVCRLRGGGAECAAGSRASGADDSAEGSGIGLIGSVEGADLDKDVPPVSVFEEEAVLGQSFLDQGLLCGHGGIGCGHDTQVCPLPGEEGAAVRAAATVRLRIITAAQLQGPPPLGAGPCPPYGGIF
jgi:hypothetical protein